VTSTSPWEREEKLEPHRLSTAGDEWKQLVSKVNVALPGLVACGVVDLDSGDWLELETGGSHPVDFLAYLAKACQSYFEGDNVKTIRAVLDGASPDRVVERQMNEIIMRSTNTLHVMVRLEKDPRRVLAVVTSADLKLGLILSTVRSVL